MRKLNATKHEFSNGSLPHAFMIGGALMLSACSSGSPFETQDPMAESADTAASVPQANVDSPTNSNTNENSTSNETEQSSENTESTDSEPPAGAATPPDNSSTDVLDPSVSVSCSATSLHIQQRTLQLINEARSEPRTCGTDAFNATTPLSWNTQLLEAANDHSADMAQHNFFDHTGSDGSTIGTRVDETGYDWRSVGENIAAGQSTATEAVEGWLESPGHCRNLMNPSFTEVAVACVEDDGADYTRYWTNVLAAPF